MFDQSACWRCDESLTQGVDVCKACDAFQPVPPEADYFGVMGLEPRMTIPKEELEKRFHELSRRYHPDKFVTKTAREKQISEQRSAALNKAYRTLRDPLALAEYLLRRAGKEVSSQTESVPPEFAEALFEIQEKLMDLKMADDDGKAALVEDLRKAKEALNDRREELAATVKECLTRWDNDRAEDNDAVRAELLETIDTTLSTRSYLNTIVRDITAAGV